MKTQQKNFQTGMLALLLVLGISAAQAQDKDPALQQAVETKSFVFDAQTVLPAGEAARQISGERYELRVSSDSLMSDLPYFGRAYSAPLDGEGGIHFTSTRFDYSYKPKKRGGWDVSIHPKDVMDVRQFLLTISKDGYATLQAQSNNRQPISFNGQVRAIQQ
jgi:hypothetical protein